MVLAEFQSFLNNRKIYKYDQATELLADVRKHFRFSYTNKQYKYFNVPAAFDIETTSFYDQNGEKTGIMYCWTFGLYGCVVFGRTWEEFRYLLYDLVRILDLNRKKRLIVYVHNLQFDFQFFRHYFQYEKVFAIDRRKPLYALTDQGIEFRCSYLLSGYALKDLDSQLQRYKCKKAVGDLNYSLIRHSNTKMTRKEINYTVMDVKVVMAYIAELIENYDGIAKLPYTKTGFVRNFCRNRCFYKDGKPVKNSDQRKEYIELMKALTITPELYTMLKRGFMGGYTHANSMYTGITVSNLSSFDFTSSYPAVMLAEKFPMSPPERVDSEQLTKESFAEYILNYCCLFNIEFFGIREKDDIFDSYLSESRCFQKSGQIVNNGRISKADYIATTITDIDFMIIRKCYDWDKIRIGTMYVWKKDYLPKDFILSILKLYGDKTTLKGVKGRETDYLVSKGMLNACYGMAVTDPVREINEYTDDWNEPYMPEMVTAIHKYNTSYSRFLYYPWGVFVTAYARRNLWSAIINLGVDYVYSDTDSVKVLNAEMHEKYFERYNKLIVWQIRKALETQGINPELAEPETIKGIKKPLGVWDYEGTYDRFKTLGAKRYMTEEDGKISLTVSGLNKNITLPFLQRTYKDIFSAFDSELYIPKGFTGKQTHTYIDYEKNGMIEDYNGEKAEYHELSGIHMEESDYSLSITREYTDYCILSMKGIYEYGKE